MPEYVTEGWTEPIDQRLLADDAVPPGTGKTLALQLLDRDGNEVDTSNKAAWIDETLGTARFSPAAGDLRASGSPYRATWKVTASGKVSSYPNRDADLWYVRK